MKKPHCGGQAKNFLEKNFYMIIQEKMKKQKL